MAGEVKITFRVPELPGFRDIRGRFASAQTESTRRNERLAIVVQSQVVGQMRNRIAFGRRASASTGRLLHTTAADGNRKFNQYGFGVGIEDHLEKSNAKYWRTFEEGSAAIWRHPFIGTELFQFRKNPGRGPSAHGTDLRTVVNRENFTGYRTANGADYIVKREIEPAHIYSTVAEQAHLREEGVQSAILILRSVFRNPIKPGGGYFER